MNTFSRIIIAAALVCLASSCNKENGTDGPGGHGSKMPTDFSGGCEAVDLGLSVKWASYNVGAQNTSGLGSYFAWGETQEKEYYDWTEEGEYKWGVYNMDDKPRYGMTKYTADVKGGDGLVTLKPEDDPATKNWGTKWRTPTLKEIEELFDKTKCSWSWDKDRKGYVVKGLKTGNSIFLPATGVRYGSSLGHAMEYGYYWSSTVDDTEPSYAYEFGFDSGRHDWAITERYHGEAVRAVTEY